MEGAGGRRNALCAQGGTPRSLPDVWCFSVGQAPASLMAGVLLVGTERAQVHRPPADQALISSPGSHAAVLAPTSGLLCPSPLGSFLRRHGVQFGPFLVLRLQPFPVLWRHASAATSFARFDPSALMAPFDHRRRPGFSLLGCAVSVRRFSGLRAVFTTHLDGPYAAFLRSPSSVPALGALSASRCLLLICRGLEPVADVM